MSVANEAKAATVETLISAIGDDKYAAIYVCFADSFDVYNRLATVNVTGLNNFLSAATGRKECDLWGKTGNGAGMRSVWGLVG